MQPTEQSGDLSIPWRSATLRVVLLSTLVSPFSIALISPGLAVFRDAFGVSDAGASLLLSAVLLPGIVLSPLLGFLTDRVGRRRVLVASLFVWSLAGGAIALGPPFTVVLMFRFVQGTALAGIGVTTVTLVGDAFDGVQRNAVLGVNTAVLSVGAAVSPVVGGALVTVSWNAPFVVYLLGLPVALVAFSTLSDPPTEHETRSSQYLRRVVSALSPTDATVFYGSAFVVDFLLFGVVFTALPFLLATSYDLSPVAIGLVVTAGEIASTVAATQNGRLSRRLSDAAILVVSFVAVGVGLLGAWLAPTPAFIAVATVGFGAGWGLALPSIDAGVSALVATQHRAGALSLRGSASSVGRAGGPLLFAAFAAQNGYRSLLLLAGFGALAFALCLALLTR